MNQNKHNNSIEPVYRLNQVQKHVLDEIPVAELSETVAKVRSRVFDSGKEWDSVNYIYIVNAKKQLRGVISIKELIAAKARTRMRSFKKDHVAVVHPHTRLQVAAARAITNNVKSLPVVDKHSKFLGVIGADLITEVMQHEHVKDTLLYSGVQSEGSFVDVFNARLWQLIKWRTPWFVIGLIGGMMATSVVGFFEASLSEVIELAFFIPAMLYMGAAVGTQAQMLFIRGMAFENVKSLQYLWREIQVDVAIAFVSSSLIALFSWVLTQSMLVVSIVSISLFLIVTFAGAVAIIAALILRKLKYDPAIGGGPITTIIQDITSLLIYFGIANLFLG